MGELIATRDEKHDKILNFRCLSQALIRIFDKLYWPLVETSYLEHFVYDVIIYILQSMVLFTIMERLLLCRNYVTMRYYLEFFGIIRFL